MARVLHIEDDSKSRLLVRKLLDAAGHEVVDAATGLQGIRAAEESKPDLVLVDINIPDLDGYEVTLRLRSMASLQGVPVVAITAEGDRETSLAVGADGFIEKPINARSFPELIERYLGGHRERALKGTDAHLRSRTQKIVQRLEHKVVELSEANQRLEEMARLRREFLQNISHEFATPMTPVVGYLRILLDEEAGPLTPLQRKCLESIDSSTQQLRRLIDTLLDVSTLETGRMHIYEREYDVAQVARRALEEARPRFERARIQVTEDPSLQRELQARGDPDKLRRALAHVMENAAKFTPRGGEVAVELEVLEHPANTVRITVADNGPGVAPGDAHKILEPFYQADGSATRSHGGVGLGLAFARRVAQALGGALEVQSPPGRPVAGRTLGGTAISMSVQRMPSAAARDTSAP